MVLRLVIVLFIVKAQADIRTVVVWFQIDQKVVDEDDYGDDDGSDDHEGYLVDDNYNDHGEHEDGVDNEIIRDRISNSVDEFMDEKKWWRHKKNIYEEAD